MSAVEPEFARDRWCWPRQEDDERVLEIEVSDRGRVDSAHSAHSDDHLIEFTTHQSRYVARKEEERTCRICLQEDIDVVQSQCACTGTQRWVHVACQDRWRLSGDAERSVVCELCHAPYESEVRNRNNGAVLDRGSSFTVACVVMVGTLLVDLLSLIFYMCEMAGTEIDSTFMQTSLIASSFLKGNVCLYVICIDKKMRVTLTSILLIYMFGLLCEYSVFLHVVLNLSFDCIVLGVVSSVDATVSTD